MRRARWLAPWKDSADKPAIYHCISRVVERRFAFGPDEREKFRTFMRMQENFSGCVVLAYCVMSNHVHLLLEVPPAPADGLSDAELFRRLGAIYGKGQVAEVAQELAAARASGDSVLAREIHARFTYRMHDLGEFMKGLMQRFTQWFNRTQERTGTLWEDRFKSVIVEDGATARTMAAYIDLNPVRAGMVEDPADYRWSGYGEASAGGKKARAGLVRAYHGRGDRQDAGAWAGELGVAYRKLLLGKAAEVVVEKTGKGGMRDAVVLRRGMKAERVAAELVACETGADGMLSALVRRRVRYFTDGAVLGSRGFVDEVFARCRERFGPKRKSGARKLRGDAAVAGERIWSMRDLRAGMH
jgi:putative transposase